MTTVPPYTPPRSDIALNDRALVSVGHTEYIQPHLTWLRGQYIAQGKRVDPATHPGAIAPLIGLEIFVRADPTTAEPYPAAERYLVTGQRPDGTHILQQDTATAAVTALLAAAQAQAQADRLNIFTQGDGLILTQRLDGSIRALVPTGITATPSTFLLGKRTLNTIILTETP